MLARAANEGAFAPIRKDPPEVSRMVTMTEFDRLMNEVEEIKRQAKKGGRREMTGRRKQAMRVQRVIRARRFELVDEDGNVRGILGLKDDGSPSFRLEQGNMCAEVELWPDGAAWLLLKGATPDVYVELGIDSQGEAAVIVGDKYGKLPHVRMGLEEDGSPYLMVLDKGKKVVFRAPEPPADTKEAA